MPDKAKEKVHPLERWRKKNQLATKTIKFDGQPINIRELSGNEREKLVKIEKNAKQGFFVWDRCINTQDNPDWTLFEDEFVSMFNMNATEMSTIIHECMDFSGLSEEAEALLEKD